MVFTLCRFVNSSFHFESDSMMSNNCTMSIFRYSCQTLKLRRGPTHQSCTKWKTLALTWPICNWYGNGKLEASCGMETWQSPWSHYGQSWTPWYQLKASLTPYHCHCDHCSMWQFSSLGQGLVSGESPPLPRSACPRLAILPEYSHHHQQ